MAIILIFVAICTLKLGSELPSKCEYEKEVSPYLVFLIELFVTLSLSSIKNWQDEIASRINESNYDLPLQFVKEISDHCIGNSYFLLENRY